MSSKLTALSEITAPSLDDLLYLVDDPSGTPTEKKVALGSLLGVALGAVCNGRLTLASGNPVYNPQPFSINTSDTGLESFGILGTDTGWVTGTMFTVTATSGGLTAGTLYFAHVVASNTISAHTTLADALADTNRVNITATPSADAIPFGIQNTTLYFAPYLGNTISLYDGTRIQAYTFTELSLSLGTLSSGANYPVFVYDNAGTLTLELGSAWTSPNGGRRESVGDISIQNGMWAKVGAATRRYVGDIRTISTTATEDSEGSIYVAGSPGTRYVYNAQNQVPRAMRATDSTATWTYTTATWRQANATATNEVRFLLGLSATPVARVVMHASNSSTNIFFVVGVGLDSTSVLDPRVMNVTGVSSAINLRGTTLAWFNGSVGCGNHRLVWLEQSGATGTCTWTGNAAPYNHGIQAEVMM